MLGPAVFIHGDVLDDGAIVSTDEEVFDALPLTHDTDLRAQSNPALTSVASFEWSLLRSKRSERVPVKPSRKPRGDPRRAHRRPASKSV
jgi:hypothetical protein